MNTLPMKIMKMVLDLHKRGYTSLYLFCGLSPSGLHWRYKIGLIGKSGWPNNGEFVFDSIGNQGTVSWAKKVTTVPHLADEFQARYLKNIKLGSSEHNEYAIWYRNLLRGLGEEEIIVFYADYDAPHATLLARAPFFNKDYAL